MSIYYSFLVIFPVVFWVLLFDTPPVVTKRKQPLTRFGLRPPEVAEALGSRVLFEEAEKAGFIKPVINRHKLKIYDAGDVARCWARIVAGELPQSMQRETAST